MDYDDARHLYSDGGLQIPSVTQILNPPSSVRYYAPGTAARGTKAHEDCAAYAEALKAGVPVPFPYEKYCDSFAMWCFKANPTVLKVETIIDAELDGYRFAGRLDLLAEIDGLATVVDFKTGVRAKWHRSQIGAYAYAEKAARGLLLYIHADMSYDEDWIIGADLAAGITGFREAINRYYGGDSGEKDVPHADLHE